MKKFRLLFLALLSVVAFSCDKSEETSETVYDYTLYTGTIESDVLSATTEGVQIAVYYSEDGSTVDMYMTGVQFDDAMPTFITFGFKDVPCTETTISQSGLVPAYYNEIPYSDKGTFHNFDFTIGEDNLLSGTFEIYSDTYSLDYEEFTFTATSVQTPDSDEDDDTTDNKYENYSSANFVGTFKLGSTYSQDNTTVTAYISSDFSSVDLVFNDFKFSSNMPSFIDMTIPDISCAHIGAGVFTATITSGVDDAISPESPDMDLSSYGTVSSLSFTITPSSSTMTGTFTLGSYDECSFTTEVKQ